MESQKVINMKVVGKRIPDNFASNTRKLKMAIDAPFGQFSKKGHESTFLRKNVHNDERVEIV